MVGRQCCWLFFDGRQSADGILVIKSVKSFTNKLCASNQISLASCQSVPHCERSRLVDLTEDEINDK